MGKNRIGGINLENILGFLLLELVRITKYYNLTFVRCKKWG
jgi:hypothetical protein